MPSVNSNNRNQQEPIEEEGQSFIHITNKNRSNNAISRLYTTNSSHSNYHQQISTTIGSKVSTNVGSKVSTNVGSKVSTTIGSKVSATIGSRYHQQISATIGSRQNHRLNHQGGEVGGAVESRFMTVGGAVESRFMTVFVLWFKSMVVRILLGIRAFALFTSRVGTCLLLMWRSQWRKVVQHQTITYPPCDVLSPLSRHRISLVNRKILVLDLDETLIHSHHDGVIRPVVPQNIPADFVLSVVIDRHPVRFFVHKRPHVDYFLDIVSQWYELVVFTASMEIYGTAVADRLDNGRGILRRRYFRQHCTLDYGSYTKDLSAISNDLSSVFILDNSPGAYRAFPDNAIPIKSWFSDPKDVALLSLLPVLDSLRFTTDVRSVLSRNLHLHNMW